MGMAGPTPAEWLNAATKRAKFDPKTGTITADANDWGNLVGAAKLAYGITDDELADLNWGDGSPQRLAEGARGVAACVIERHESASVQRFLRENPDVRDLLAQSCKELRGDIPSMPVHEWALVRIGPLRRLLAFVEIRVLDMEQPLGESRS